MNTDSSLDQSLAIHQDEEKTTMRWETVRKRGIDSTGGGAVKNAKRTKQTDEANVVKQSVKVAASKFKTFPERLMEILEEKPNLQEAIYWLENGSAFALLPYPFAAKVLNVYFQGAKLESFTRKLNRWGFKRIFDDEYDPEAYVYQHPMFQRSRPELLQNLTGSNGKKKKEAPVKQQQKPVQPVPSTSTPRSFQPNNNNVPTMQSVMMQRPFLMNSNNNNNNNNNNNALSHSLSPQLSFVVVPNTTNNNNNNMQRPNNNINTTNHLMSVNHHPLLHHQQFLEQQRLRQQQLLFAQLQAARGEQQQLMSVQELQFLQAQQNANRVRMLQQLQPPSPAPAPTSM